LRRPKLYKGVVEPYKKKEVIKLVPHFVSEAGSTLVFRLVSKT